MEQIVLVVHLILAVALVATVLMQRSEGGALGIGGGNSGGGMMSGRAASTLLSRATGILAASFMCTSLTLAVLASGHSGGGSILDTVDDLQAPVAPVESTVPSVPVAE